MSVDDLAERVGRVLFRRACATAWATAAQSGSRESVDWPDDEADVPHELSDLIDGDTALGFALYRAMPCYGVLMYVGFEPHDDAFWAEVRSLLDDPDDRLAQPMAYWLWCEPFEGAEVHDAWREVTDVAPDPRLRRVLDISGPVPWQLKAPLLDRLSQHAEWAETVCVALERAAFDHFGSVDLPAARAMLAGLDLPDERVKMLRAKLGQA